MISGDWTLVVREIDTLLADARYAWATERLNALEAAITEAKFATLGQRNAVAAIKSSKRAQEASGSTAYPQDRRDKSLGARRYEGYEGFQR